MRQQLRERVLELAGARQVGRVGATAGDLSHLLVLQSLHQMRCGTKVGVAEAELPLIARAPRVHFPQPREHCSVEGPCTQPQVRVRDRRESRCQTAEALVSGSTTSGRSKHGSYIHVHRMSKTQCLQSHVATDVHLHLCMTA